MTSTTTPSLESRLASFVRSIASSCRGCPRRDTADCIHRCAGYGAEALIRELDERAATKSSAKYVRQPESDSSNGHKLAVSERRQKILDSMPACIPLTSQQIDHPDGANATNKTKDLQDMCKKGMLIRTRSDDGHHWRYIKPEPSKS